MKFYLAIKRKLKSRSLLPLTGNTFEMLESSVREKQERQKKEK